MPTYKFGQIDIASQDFHRWRQIIDILAIDVNKWYAIMETYIYNTFNYEVSRYDKNSANTLSSNVYRVWVNSSLVKYHWSQFINLVSMGYGKVPDGIILN